MKCNPAVILLSVTCLATFSINSLVYAQNDDGADDDDDYKQREWANINVDVRAIEIESETKAESIGKVESHEQWRILNDEHLRVRMESSFKSKLGDSELEKESKMRFTLVGSGCYSTLDGATPVPSDAVSFRHFNSTWGEFNCTHDATAATLDCSTVSTVDTCETTFMLHMSATPTTLDNGMTIDGRGMKFDIQSSNCTCEGSNKIGYEIHIRSKSSEEHQDNDSDNDEEIGAEAESDEEASVSLAPRFGWLGTADQISGCSGSPITVTRSAIEATGDEEGEADDGDTNRRIIFVMDRPANETCFGHLWDPKMQFGADNLAFAFEPSASSAMGPSVLLAALAALASIIALVA